ncbi:MAG: hypothetical protein Q8Q35_01200 [Nanoarchaeota archaeon]|nr:hypothetical protein [Nanoarchaeota archaeon]
MQIKRGLIYLVLLLILIPIIYSAPRSATVIDDTLQPSYLSCDDGTRFATCKPNSNLFCSNQNLILNGGFESDSNQDGIPNLFLPDGILGTNLLISTNPFSGLKAALIKSQWSSFDYFPFLGLPTILQPSTDYIFFSFVKGTCQDDSLRVFYGATGSGAEYLCGRDRDTLCNLIPVTNGWSRLIVQFNSDEIATKWIDEREKIQIPIIQNLRVECADSTPFELYVDNMHLQPLNSQPQLVENCQICGSCPSGLFCAPDGSCVSDLSNFYTDEELMERCIAENNFALCERIQEPATKSLASNQFAVENSDITKCEGIICQQSVLYFSCLDQGRTNCAEESLSGISRDADFTIGRDVFIRNNKDFELKRYRLGGDNRDSNKCDIHIQQQEEGIFIFNTDKFDYYGKVDHGIVISHSEGNSFADFISSISSEVDCISENIMGFCYEHMSKPFGTLSSSERDCSDSSCNLLETSSNGQKVPLGPKADLLCGFDDRWYLCDKNGIKEFDNGQQYVCDSASGIWTRLN